MRNRKADLLLFVILGAGLFMACNSPYTSRKRAYFNIPLPAHQYRSFDTSGFPYSFDYPVYANIIRDSTYFDATPENNYWINVDFPQFGARIFLSYKEIGGKAYYKVKGKDGVYRDSTGINQFDRMVNDAFTLTSKNEALATSISDSMFTTPAGVTGVYFKVGGNAATSRQFFMSDTTKNFIRGALYFDTTPNADSLRPVQDFLQQDILHLINSFQWKKP